MTARRGSTRIGYGLTPIACAYVAAFSLHFSTLAFAQLDFEAAPINYKSAPTDDVVHNLQASMDSTEKRLSHDQERGYLESVLCALDIPISSQVLVFSKTSFQQRRISPRRPRAIYFNDDTYLGWVQHGDALEISTASPQQGAIFYTLDQKETDRPTFKRDQGQCIVCHASSRTSGVPGHLVRSVFPGRNGQPNFGSGTFNIDHRSPFKKRWGGWYVTGTHGRQRHMGNVVVEEASRPEQLDHERGANVIQLKEFFNTQPYLTEHSDIVALMVLEHQTRMHNLITRANFEARSAHHYDSVMNKALDRPTDHRSDSAKRRIASAAKKLVEYMLFVDEVKLTDKVEGTSQFASEFTRRGPCDRKGRSLRDFDLTTRMMKYPCSYLIYSQSFDGLPSEVKAVVLHQLYEVLTDTNAEEQFSHLSRDDRQAILEILRETKSDLPEYWL